MSKIFFDANILLDILLPARPNHHKALTAYEAICQQYTTLATSENILTTIEYIASRNGTDCHTLTQFFKGLRENFDLYGFADILGHSLIIYEQSCDKNDRIDFEDLLQIQCAIAHKCDTFITEDKGIHAQYDAITVIGLNDVV